MEGPADDEPAGPVRLRQVEDPRVSAHYRRVVRVVKDDWRTLNSLRRKLKMKPVRNGYLVFLACGHSKWVTVLRNPHRALCPSCPR